MRYNFELDGLGCLVHVDPTHFDPSKPWVGGSMTHLMTQTIFTSYILPQPAQPAWHSYCCRFLVFVTAPKIC